MITEIAMTRWKYTIQLFCALRQATCILQNNIIYIDRPDNHKTRLEQSFAFLKSLPSTHHTNFKTLPLPSKLQKKKWEERLSQILEPLFFPTYSTASFLSWFSSGKPTQAHTSGLSYQTRIYRTCATICPSVSQLSKFLSSSLRLMQKVWRGIFEN